MNDRFKVFAGLVATGGIIGFGWSLISPKLSANLPELKSSSELKSSLINQSVTRKKTYSWQLVRPYTKGCTNKLQKKRGIFRYSSFSL